VKKEKVREKGFLIAEIPSRKKKKFVKRLPDSQKSIEKKEKVREKGFLIARSPS
jgi:hypothetical protein